MHLIAELCISVIMLYQWTVMAWFVMSLLEQWNLLNRYHPVVRRVSHSLHLLVDPPLRTIRRVVPLIGGVVDLSPLILFFALGLMRRLFLYI